jgi:hypothetical protein
MNKVLDKGIGGDTQSITNFLSELFKKGQPNSGMTTNVPSSTWLYGAPNNGQFNTIG